MRHRWIRRVHTEKIAHRSPRRGISALRLGPRLKDSINFAYAVGAKNTAHKIMEFNPDFKVLHFHANEPTRPHS